MSIQLSICMPIYNCAEFVGQALDSILPQTDEETEVIVYDGGSTDSTSSLMQAYLQIWSNLRYYRGEARGGIDADMAKCVGYARGEYIWLFSGDDVMRPSSIARLREWLRKGCDVYLCEHSICDLNMNFLKTYPMFTPNQKLCIDLAEATSRKEWFHRACSTEPFFSYMSSLIVRREKWESGRLIEEFDGSCWGHVARLFALIPTGLRVCYIAEVWLDMRSGNDSFLDKGVVNRYSIAIDGYHKIANTFFGHDSEEAFHMRRVIRREFTLPMFYYAKALCKRNPQVESIEKLDALAQKIWSDDSLSEQFYYAAYKLRGWMYEFVRFMCRCWFFVRLRLIQR